MAAPGRSTTCTCMPASRMAAWSNTTIWRWNCAGSSTRTCPRRKPASSRCPIHRASASGPTATRSARSRSCRCRRATRKDNHRVTDRARRAILRRGAWKERRQKPRHWEEDMIRMPVPSRRAVLTGASALALGATFGTHPQAQAREVTARQKELYELARKEGEVTWYTAHSNDTTAQALGRDFEAAFPGIKANVVRTTAQVAYQRVSQEIKAGAMQVDVLSSTDIGHCVSLKENNQPERHVPDNASKVLDVYKNYDPDGYYTVTSAGLIGIGYNTAKLKEADAPKNWPDLLDPKWKDKIALGHPGFSGYVGTWVVSLKKLYGWGFFENLAANKPQVGRSINDTVTMLNAGERIVAGSEEHT